MTYALIAIVLIISGMLIFHFMAKKPELQKIDSGDPEPRKNRTSHSAEARASEWDDILDNALRYIYSGHPSTMEIQMSAMHADPSALAKTAISGLVHAFEKMGSLHSSLSAVDNPYVSMKELGDMVTRDPVLSARVLKTVNSPFFGLAQGVRSIHTAVNILGLNQLKAIIAFGATPYDLYTRPEHQKMFRDIWRHMNNTAITASHLAKAGRDLDSGSLYTAGLMHDIGKLVLVLLIKDGNHLDSYPQTLATEYELLSATHVQAARILSDGSGIPDRLKFLVLGHHLPAMMPVSELRFGAEQVKSLTILFLANQVAKLITKDGTLKENLEPLDRFDPSYSEIISIEEARQVLFSQGLIRDILDTSRVVRGMLN